MPSITPSVIIETHGCKLNTADSQRIARDLITAGFTIAGEAETPDVYLLNSCTVTHVADRKARQAISAARRKFPDALIVAAGCYPERDTETVAALAGVDLVITNRQKPEIVARLSERLAIKPALNTARKSGLNPNGDVFDPMLSLLGRTRASIKIQEGCDQVCAYCIVPTVRGRERSVPVAEIVDQANQASERGCKEIVLTGTQLGSYGFDMEGTSLPDMLRTLLRETGVQRVRVSSLQPQEITDELLELWSDSASVRLCPHFHIALQSGSDAVLERMRRRYTADGFLSAVRRVRDAVPGVAITTDVIAGFPGETDEDFENTVAVLEAAAFADLHVFPYSARPGTSAAHFGEQVPDQVRAERAAAIRELGARDFRHFREALAGQTHTVLWERDDPADGLTANYVRVRLDPHFRSRRGTGRARANAIEDVILGEFNDGLMMATPA
ncbi:MAG: tRNA (N(6)-L-threonylcarbamoyladenosine(37)-C(2))-methylthiotransferase MtaB [Chloroflexi bacterium]|nr:tRNA (N(6)-L-threonylcarbamoyladenosine(37)-C(2))-methylthiotransferase MtaB [Chloroflexota bacterium]